MRFDVKYPAHHVGSREVKILSHPDQLSSFKTATTYLAETAKVTTTYQVQQPQHTVKYEQTNDGSIDIKMIMKLNKNESIRINPFIHT